MKRIKKRATIISTNFRANSKKFKPIKRDKKLIYLTIVFAFGLLSGAILIKTGNPKMINNLQTNLSEIIKKIASQGFFENGLFVLKFQTISMFFLFFLGLSILGEGFLWLFPATQGILLGMTSSFFYSKGSVAGMTYFSVIWLIPLVFAISSFLLGCKESILTERDLNQYFFKGKQEKGGRTLLKLYSLRYIFFYLGNIFSSFLFAILNLLLQNRFNLSFLS